MEQYAKNNWGEFLEQISEISKNDNNKPLVTSDNKIYNFDKICESLYGKSHKPTSADGLEIFGNKITLVEFKSGFKKTITKNPYDPSKLKCPQDENKICNDYGKLQLKKLKQDTNELKYSIQLKALESHITLEKKILSKCQNNTNYQIVLIVVIDADSIESEEDIYTTLGTQKSNDDSNDYISLKRSLSKYNKNILGLYNKIEVFSAIDYTNYLKK